MIKTEQSRRSDRQVGYRAEDMAMAQKRRVTFQLLISPSTWYQVRLMALALVPPGSYGIGVHEGN